MIDHLDGEIRRAVQELGDAAGVPPAFDDLGARPLGARRGAPRWRAVALVAAAAVVVGVVLIVSRAGRDPRPADPSATTPSDRSAPTPVSTVPATCGPDGCAAGDDPAPFDDLQRAVLDLVRPVLPDGLTLVYVSPTRPRAVAVDADFARVELVVSIGGGQQVRDAQAGGPGDTTTVGQTLHPVPGGEASPDGLLIVTELGDAVSAVVSGPPNDSESPAEATEQAAAALVAGVASSLDPAAHEALGARGVAPPLGTAGLAEQVGAELEQHTRWARSGGGGSDPGALTTWVTPRESGDGAGTIALSAYHTPLRLPDATVRSSSQRVTATRWIDGWQLVLTAYATSDDPAPATADELAAWLDALGETFAAWEPAVVTEPVCGTYTFAVMDDVGLIADRFGIAVDELVATNPDILDTAVAGDDVALPCTAAEPTRSTDPTGLAAFASQADAGGTPFEPIGSVTVATDRFVWVVSGGSDASTGAGAVRVERFDRASGTPQRDTAGSIGRSGGRSCAGPIEVLDDGAASLDAIPVRCTADGRTGTVDVWNGAVAGL